MKIHCIEIGKVRIKKNQQRKVEGMTPGLVKVLFGREWTGWLPIYAWVIEHPGGLIVVDTGDTARTMEKGYLPRWHPYYALAVQFDIQPEEEIGPQLKKMGINPQKDVRKVILTHFHTDHAGGLHHFAEVEIFADEKEYTSALGIPGIIAGYLPHRWPQWLSPSFIELTDGPFGPFEASKKMTEDGNVIAVATPGHTPNHLSVIVKKQDLYYFLAGDTSYSQELMVQGIPDGVGSRKSIDTLRKIRQFAHDKQVIYLPSHDPDGKRRLQIEEPVRIMSDNN